jgi:hypothetical protein
MRRRRSLSVTVVIHRDQRDGIYELVRDHLRGIGDVWVAMGESEEHATAEQLSREYLEDFRLLQDISWSPVDSRSLFALTMPAPDLAELLRRMQDEALQILRGAAADGPRSEEDIELNHRFQVAYHTCEELLARLGESANPD